MNLGGSDMETCPLKFQQLVKTRISQQQKLTLSSVPESVTGGLCQKGTSNEGVVKKII